MSSENVAHGAHGGGTRPAAPLQSREGEAYGATRGQWATSNTAVLQVQRQMCRPHQDGDKSAAALFELISTHSGRFITARCLVSISAI